MLLIALLACARPAPADLVVSGGTVRLDADATTDALAVRGGAVVAVGEDALALEATDRFDLAGATAVPGFHDAHTHLLPGAFVLDRILLQSATSMEGVAAKVADYGAEHPDEPWLVGYGWTDRALESPDGRALDAAAPDRPVLLMNASGHSGLVNPFALALAGIDASTPDPDGGEIVRDPLTGEATGLLRESALALVLPRMLAAYDDAALRASLEPRLAEFARGGITSVSEIIAAPGVSVDRPWIYTELDAEGALPLRVHLWMPVFALDDLHAVDAARAEHESERVRIVGAKLWIDGSLASLEAWTTSPYASTGGTGTRGFGAEELGAIALLAEDLGIPLKMHAMGDAAIDAALDALEAASDARGGLTQAHVIDHAVLADADARARMATLGVVASMQPVSWTTAAFADWDDELDDWELDDSYPWRELVDAGVPVALGTDWPVWPTGSGPVTLWAAASLRDERALTPSEALRGFTAGSARGVGRDDLGCLRVGCVADLTLLDEDPVEVAPEDLGQLEILGTFLGGRQVR